jgi:ABC-2 type transport system permease protein
MRLALTHAKANTVELMRQPQFWVPSIGFPLLFFALFGLNASEQVAANVPEGADTGGEVVLAQFMLFGVLSVMFFQFGAGIAEERQLPWERTLRVLPLSASTRFLGRVGAAMVFSVASAVPVLIFAAVATTLRLDPIEWLPYLAAVFVGAIPFGLMGITVGYTTTPKAAIPIANIGFLLLSFVGGLFVPIEILPELLQEVNPFMPTDHWLDFTLGVVDRRPDSDAGSWILPAVYLAGWTAVSLAAAAFAYRRDLVRRFH